MKHIKIIIKVRTLELILTAKFLFRAGVKGQWRNLHINPSPVCNFPFKFTTWCCFCGYLVLEFSPYERRERLRGNIVQLITCAVRSGHFCFVHAVWRANCSCGGLRFFALCMIGLRVPTYIFQPLHPSSLRTHTATEPIDPLQMYVIAGLFAQAFRASYSNLFHQPVLSPCTLISFPAILLLDTLTSSAPVWLAAPHLLDTLTSFTPFEQCKGETTSDCLTDFATVSEQTGPVRECC